MSVVEHAADVQDSVGIEIGWLETNRFFSTETGGCQEQYQCAVRLLLFTKSLGNWIRIGHTKPLILIQTFVSTL